MDTATIPAPARITFETRPSQYKHWKLDFDGPIATLAMNCQEDGGLSPDYRLKLNSYDLGVDIELADAIQRIRFEHPEIGVVVIASLKDRIFSAGANIFMLRGASHAWKVNFCKFTNETRLAIEDASMHSGLKFIAAVNGTCAGGGYELALACDEIVLVDDSNSSVSLPETPLLGVLPGTGGLTRLVDKRKVRRDHADVFATLAEGVKGRRAVDWRLVDAVVPASRFRDHVRDRAARIAAGTDRAANAPAIQLGPLEVSETTAGLEYSSVSCTFERSKRTATLVVRAPKEAVPSTPEGIVAQGDRFWPLRAFRELDDAILRLRLNEPELGTVIVMTDGDGDLVLEADEVLHAHRSHWLVREVIHFMKRTLKRIDLSARSFFAVIEPGHAFVGSLFELALAADRSYMLDAAERPNAVQLSAMNGGLLTMSNGLSRLETRFYDNRAHVDRLLAHQAPFDAQDALEAGLVTFAPDDLDWDDEIRQAIEGRAALSPDALTGLEANLRFVGPETLETKIFGRLSAWQNWIFQRPNAVGPHGALTSYGLPERAAFDFKRT
jgi:benzoyl-CoA-dihydrodiol lyase